MRMPRTLSRYLARETLQYAAVGFLSIATLLLANSLLRQIEDLLGIGGGLADLAAVTARLLAILTTYALPIAFLFGTLVAFGRLGSDHEVLAFRSLGISLVQLAAPALALALLASVVTGWLLQRGEVDARRSVLALVGEVASRGGVIRAGAFTKLDKQGERMLFVDRRTKDGTFEGVLISDRSDPKRAFSVLATSGSFEFDRETAIGHLVLRGGDVHFDPESPSSDRTQRIGFERFDYAFDMSRVVGEGPERLRPRDMTREELLAALAHFDAHGSAPAGAKEQRRAAYEVQLQRRAALAVSPLAFCMLAVPLGLGLGLRRGARSLGALLCAVIAFGYYVVMNAASAYATDGTISAAMALWLPNVACVGVALPLWWRARRADGR
jgi:lipopolysaccharide export LptBFGC system permease protein LptF